jgi:hypothetical protein
MKNIIYLLIPALMLALASFSGCEKKNNPDTITVEGTIVSFLDPCSGNGILIAVENLENFGESGTIVYPPDSLLNYHNAIIVPYFHKYTIDGIDQITSLSNGDKLKFECRKATTEADISLFDNYDYPCPAIYAPIPAPCYIVTKIINYEKQ